MWSPESSRYLSLPIFGAVAVVNGIVYAGGGDGTLYAFNASNGALIWALTGPGEFPEIRCSPAVANGVVYVGYNTGDLLAANAADGHVVWTGTTSLTGIIEASPAVANGVLYVAAEDDNLYAFDAATGKQLKKIALSVFVSSPAVSHGKVLIGGFADHKLHAYM